MGRQMVGRAGQSGPNSGGVRAALMVACLEAVGEVGYREASVREVTRRAGHSRASFYRHFENGEQCFSQAYETLAAELCEELIGRGRGGEDWRAGFGLGLESFLGFVAAQPRLARALLIEVHGAGGLARRAHEEASERLAGTLHRARRKSGGAEAERLPRERMVIGAIEQSACRLLIGGEARRAAELAGELESFAMLQFLVEAG